MKRLSSFRVGRLLAAALASAALLVAGTAASDDRGGKANWVDDIVSAVDARSGTLTAGDRILRVGERTRMTDAAGRSIRLHEIQIGQMVSYQATDRRRGDIGVLRRLRVIEGDFE